MLKARRLAVPEIDAGLRQAMFALFARYYGNISESRFAEDLDGKQFALLLEDQGKLAGFTTARSFDWRAGDAVHHIVFSGDTIIERAHWGQQALARAWLEAMGNLAAERADQRLFWFLIVKGHRTWRYLPAFARRFVPHWQAPGDAELMALRDGLAQSLYGKGFDQASGVIRFAEARGNLLPDWAKPSERECSLPEVAFFLHANPGFALGDELACLCEIARDNMRPLAQRWFDRGFDASA